MNNLLQKSIEKQGPQQSADAQNLSQNTVSEAYAAKVRKSKRRPKNRQKRQKNVEAMGPKTRRKNRTGETPENTKNPRKMVLPGPLGAPWDDRIVNFWGSGGGSKNHRKKGSQKKCFLGVFWRLGLNLGFPEDFRVGWAV